MNTFTKPTADLEALRNMVQDFRPNPQRMPFTSLKSADTSIADLRQKKASYATIADLLIPHGVKTRRARVAEYGRIILDGGKLRKRRMRAKPAPAIVVPAAPQSAPAADVKPTPATTAPASNVPSQASEYSPYTSRGSRMANAKMMSPEEAAELDAFLKSGSGSKS
jgi:hypothetical protein